jgi:Family of unknown function (DUF6221)
MLADMGALENFLLARIAEVESSVDGLVEPTRSRLLATFEATRRAIAIRLAALDAHHWATEVPDYDVALWDVLTVLALPYSDHPDYSAAFRPSSRADVDPQPNGPVTALPLAGTIAQSQAEQQAYFHVAITLAQAVVADNPTTPEEWISTSIGVIGSAWSTEQSTELILSRALLAMTRLAVAEADHLARARLGSAPSPGEVSAVLASIPSEPS